MLKILGEQLYGGSSDLCSIVIRVSADTKRSENGNPTGDALPNHSLRNPHTNLLEYLLYGSQRRPPN